MKIKAKKSEYFGPALWVLIFALVISFFTFFVYLTETDFPDEDLFTLLSALRYSSLLVCVSSLFLLATAIINMIRFPSTKGILIIVTLFLCLLYGAGLFIMDAFVISITQGTS